CEIQTKDPIQTFNKTQKIIVFTVLIVFGYGLYMYATKIENKTMFTKKISVMLMSAEELKAIEEAKAAKEFEEF
ncbi:MAG: DUF4395 domain-containing protein, partial [Sulfurovum sp.]